MTAPTRLAPATPWAGRRRPLRLCLVGDSHLAALRAGWGLARPGGVTPVFVPVRAASFGQIAPRQGRLVATGPDAAADWAGFGVDGPLSLGSFDAFAVVGAGFGCFRAIDVYARARFAALPDAARAVAAQPGPQLVSRAAFVAAVAGRMAAKAGPRLALALSAACPGQPVLLLAQPSPLAGVAPQDPALALHAWAEQAGDGPGLRAVLSEASAGLCAGRVTPIWQPEETRLGALFTDPRFALDAPRLDPGDTRPQPQGDVLHANADYGASMIARLAETLLPAG
ncbi:MAG: hypothetical protein JJU40_07235 [Rhodobacteraceae bacterium]|nr:hypothetical protein [Paracoccaceae bacterium]